MSMIKALYDYFAACPLLLGRRLNVDFLPGDTRRGGAEYSIDAAAAAEVVSPYMDGGALCRYAFTLRSVADYDADALQNIQNSGFFEALARWMRAQTKNRQLPALGAGMQCRAVQAVGTACLMDIGAGPVQQHQQAARGAGAGKARAQGLHPPPARPH